MMMKTGRKRPKDGHTYEYLGWEYDYVTWHSALGRWLQTDAAGNGNTAAWKCNPGAIGDLVSTRASRASAIKGMTPQEAIALARKKLIENFDSQRGYVARYAVVRPNGTVGYEHGACHSALGRYERGCLALVTAPSSHMWGNRENWCGNRHAGTYYTGDNPRFMPACERFWKYLTHDSPLSDCFLERVHWKDVARQGIAMNIDKPTRVLMLAIIATRWFYEYPNRVFMWDAAVHAGCHPWHAMLMAECTSLGGRNMVRAVRCGGIHDVFDVNNVNLTRFCKFDLVNEGHKAKDSCSYRGLHTLFEGQGNNLVGALERAKPETIQTKEFDVVTLKTKVVITRSITIKSMAEKMASISESWSERYA